MQSWVIADQLIMFCQVGLAAIGTFLLLEWTQPALIYDQGTGLPKNELVTPVTIGVAVGLLVLMYFRRSSSSSGYMPRASSAPSMMQALKVDDGVPLSSLDGFIPAPEPTLPPATFMES